MTLIPEACEQRSIIKILAGSHIHGLNVPESDRDEEAIVVEPLEESWRLGKPWEDMVGETPTLDVKYFSLRKWCAMVVNGNPNFLLALFAPESHILSINDYGSQLRSMREAFISKRAIRSHLGYMQGQRTRMLNHNKEFAAGGGHGLPRYDLVEKYGYDTKFAMHLLRLGYQGRELAEDGRITLPLPEKIRDEFLAVRAGKLPLDTVLKMADDLEAGTKMAFDTSTLPDQPHTEAVEAWMRRVYLSTWTADARMQEMFERATFPEQTRH